MGKAMQAYEFIKFKDNPYELINWLLSIHPKVAIIIDENIMTGINLSSSNEKLLLVPFIAKEENKTRRVKEQIEDILLDFGLKKNDAILAIGGGITLDLSGFIASTLLRGLPIYSIPTTLLAMVDAAIGGKTGVNTQQGKNMIGSIYLAKKIFIDTDFLKTLPDVEILSGTGEIIKYGIIGNEEILTQLTHIHEFSQEMIENCIVLKDSVATLDLFDQNLRQILNFGHTIAHAIEKASNFLIPHGIAVFYGMMVEVKLSNYFFKHYNLLFELKSKFSFPDFDLECLDWTAFEKALSHDKKNSSKLASVVINSPLIDKNCKMITQEFPIELLVQMTKEMANEFANIKK